MANKASMGTKRKQRTAKASRPPRARYQIRCTSCGFTKPWPRAGRLKPGARAYLISACPGCKRIHMHAIEEVPSGPLPGGG